MSQSRLYDRFLEFERIQSADFIKQFPTSIPGHGRQTTDASYMKSLDNPRPDKPGSKRQPSGFGHDDVVSIAQ